MTLKERVFQSLDTAVNENGYMELITMDPIEVCNDLMMYDSDLENEDPALVHPLVEEWQINRR